ncbi:hypothetical protein [Clostridium tertium]|jgi:hypothetical protein
METTIPEIAELLRLSRTLLRQLKIISKNGIPETDKEIILIALVNIQNEIFELTKKPG